MNSMNISKLLFACFVFLYFAPLTQAGNTSPTATAMTKGTGFYTITYSFTTKDYELEVPIFTKRTSKETNLSEVGYTFTTSEGGNNDVGKTVGVVSSNMSSKKMVCIMSPKTSPQPLLFSSPLSLKKMTRE